MSQPEAVPEGSIGIDPQDVINELVTQVAELSGQLAMARATIKALRPPKPAPESES